MVIVYNHTVKEAHTEERKREKKERYVRGIDVGSTTVTHTLKKKSAVDDHEEQPVRDRTPTSFVSWLSLVR